MREYTAGHKPVFDELKAAGALPDQFDIVCRLIDSHVGVAPDGAITIRDTDGSVALDPANDWQPHTAKSFVAHLQRTRRDLFDRAAPVSKAASLPTEAPPPVESFTALNARAKAGDAGALAQLHADIRQRGSLPDPTATTLTALMAAAKRGDTSARATLEAKLHRR